jgi:hypothetical protein
VALFNLSLNCANPDTRCNPFAGPIDLCMKLLKRWPELKIDMFTSAAYAAFQDNPIYLSEHTEWIKLMNELPANFRVNCGGYFHRRLSVAHGNSNNGEFEHTTRTETSLLLKHAMDEFNRAGLKCSKVFRAPGFKLGIEAALELNKQGFTISCDSKSHDVFKDLGIKLVVSNWNVKDSCREPGDVMAFGSCLTSSNNYFDKTVYDMITRLLGSREFEFKLLEEV